MAQQIADRRDIDFVMFEQFAVDQLSQSEQFAEFNRKTIEMIVKEARNLALKEILPTNKIGDDKGVSLENGQVRVPEEFHRAYRLYCEGEWVGTTENPDYGGQGMPKSVGMGASDYLLGANTALNLYIGLTTGAGHLIEEFGTEQQKKMFLEKIYTGQWGGTMLLTEPQAGSDLGAITTQATPNGDGTYNLSGQKIFITGGDQDMTENIVHPVLARIEGAPAGTAGISLFLVPKYWVHEDGSMGEFNDIVCSGVEEKMGIHGSSTCTMNLGDKGRCKGMLLGRENKGMRQMFLMMNQARLLVGMQGLALASNSYMNAVNYAREREQGRHLMNMADKSAPAVPLIQHPDVRRMLLNMKVYADGMRSLIYYANYCEDRKRVAESEDEQEKYQNIIDVLIPICKAYCTDRAIDVCNLGIQIYGGFGYIREYPQEQLLRDCRITPIYEGTNGIQAMDLLGRKLGMKKGKAIMDLMGEVHTTIAQAKEVSRVAESAEQVEKAVNKLAEVSMNIGQKAASEEVMKAFANAYPFMEVSGDVVMAWMLLWRSTVAAQQLDGAKKKDVPFYEGQIKTMEYFVNSVLPITLGKMDLINHLDATAVDMEEDHFGGK
ncbi:MAG: acyl-CoA dehydrogenase [Desulfohalobiaceae bacterium]|nr:acyl-CoA dehydrogenase [Desulfohalobiaceae bacterium]